MNVHGFAPNRIHVNVTVNIHGGPETQYSRECSRFEPRLIVHLSGFAIHALWACKKREYSRFGAQKESIVNNLRFGANS